ncbi:MAG: ABC transporter ATP-binding protein [Arachnia propionica]|uniref:ABC transporter ATP-binding protein n=1 Tax=Arachnia propionica TaxID=1750 RepID=UPI0021AB69A8|nr:ABC transporter ATP-binding protein [Arachnia propionica]MDO5082214.1 ABC transporter ATP-binding protein [Arachnia propionica]
MTPTSPVLSLRGITKRFGTLTANEDISLDVVPGRIHCLLGENGAGKSTLMNILFGLLTPDEGEIRMGEQVLRLGDPGQAMQAGIGMVHQHFMLIPPFTVAENMVLGHEPGNHGLLDIRQARAKVKELSERYRLDVDPDALVADLPVGIQQRVEILKSLSLDARYLIFDEPTAVLTPQEIDELMTVMRALRDEGRAIVFITHKLREVREVADDITVIRRGRVVGQADPESSESDLAALMVGRSVELKVAKEEPEPGAERLNVKGLVVTSPSGAIAVDELDLAVRGGEIIVIAGVQGNGQSELAEALLGTVTPVSGTITLDGVDITHMTPARTLAAGLGYVPEDRHRDGFVGDFSIAQNLVLDNLAEFSRRGNLQLGRINDNAVARVEEFDIRTGSHTQPVKSLSGGNQQKVVLARELSRPLSLLLANQPTRGVDVGAIEFLHSRIVAERDKGTAVLIISTELDEVESLADRIAVMYRGRIVGLVPPETPRNVLGLMMAGIGYDDAVAAAAEEEAGA